jgi:hypothetical protein
VGRARTTQELHGAVRSGTAGCGLFQDHWPCTGRRSYASSHAHLGTAGRETILGIAGCERAVEELRDLEWTYASTHAYLGTAGCGTRKGTVGYELA